jgi:hypothetical protein
MQEVEEIYEEDLLDEQTDDLISKRVEKHKFRKNMAQNGRNGPI